MTIIMKNGQIERRISEHIIDTRASNGGTK